MALADPNDPAQTAARLAGLLDSAMDGILSIDGAQKIVLYNRAAERIFGWTAAEAIGQRVEFLMPERFRRTHGRFVTLFGQTGVTSRRMGDATVVMGQRKDGTEFPMDASISQIDTPDGKLYTAIIRDVTERERARQDLATFAAEASGVREQEKARIARELHDELAQSLSALRMDTIWARDHLVDQPAEAAGKLQQMLSMIDTCVASTRRIAADLRPPVLDDLGLAAAIEWLAHAFTERSGVPCDVEQDDDLELHEPHATAVFRIVQESLANAGKHANASRVLVRIALDAGDLVLHVRDDGRGFSPGDPRKPQSLGLVGLRERALLLKGSLVVTSSPGAGTSVDARIPIARPGS